VAELARCKNGRTDVTYFDRFHRDWLGVVVGTATHHYHGNNSRNNANEDEGFFHGRFL
jgi:hypothetical protein